MRRRHRIAGGPVCLTAVVMAVLLQGCQALNPSAQAGAMDEIRFRHLWHLYRHCLASTDAGAMRQDAARLSRAAHEAAAVVASPPPFLPKPLARLVSTPPLRLSVDPEALATSCALEAGQVALATGQTDLAVEMFYSVIQAHAPDKHAYYAEQARAGLGKLRDEAPAVYEVLLPQSPPTSFVAFPLSRR
ncbi:MAG: hypothetical protein ACREIS_06460 [Nitrospiraceae bacterium]